jgi:hypothetical protein
MRRQENMVKTPTILPKEESNSWRSINTKLKQGRDPPGRRSVINDLGRLFARLINTAARLQGKETGDIVALKVEVQIRTKKIFPVFHTRYTSKKWVASRWYKGTSTTK